MSAAEVAGITKPLVDLQKQFKKEVVDTLDVGKAQATVVRWGSQVPAAGSPSTSCLLPRCHV
jgi:hypothetical protein